MASQRRSDATGIGGDPDSMAKPARNVLPDLDTTGRPFNPYDALGVSPAIASQWASASDVDRARRTASRHLLCAQTRNCTPVWPTQSDVNISADFLCELFNSENVATSIDVVLNRFQGMQRTFFAEENPESGRVFDLGTESPSILISESEDSEAVRGGVQRQRQRPSRSPIVISDSDDDEAYRPNISFPQLCS